MRRQVSAPGVSSNDHMTKPSVITNQAPANSPTRRGRERSKYIALVPLCCIAVISTLVNVYVDLLVFTRIAGTS